MTTLTEIEVRRIRDETIREVIRRLTKGATDRERIGSRVVAWEYRLKDAAQREKMLILAKRLGVSAPRVSQAVAVADAELHAILNAPIAS